MLTDVLKVDFPWDTVAQFKAKAAAHPEGIIDMSVGTPSDDVPAEIQRALADGSNAFAYPTTKGTLELRQAIAKFFKGLTGVSLDPESQVIPTIGSKEAVALLPAFLGLGPGDTVVAPVNAYPTYEVGALAAGCNFVRADDPEAWANDRSVKLVWINSPSNPTGQILTKTQLEKIYVSAQKIGAVVASDECYATLIWDDAKNNFTSMLEVAASQNFENVLVLYSLSKHLNLAGMRSAAIVGDEQLVSKILEVRKQIGLIVPTPIQKATAFAFSHAELGDAQVEIYRQRRAVLKAALEDIGYQIFDSQGGLYLWTDCLTGNANDELAYLAEVGIHPAPGTFYNPEATDRMRWSLTAKNIDQVAARLESLS